ncbi:hypothetical protein [Vibrio astriarenae]|uniref:hypothetical protein n=1 Tax=Vibrio astriarenae TaxID=1481923 RepID=UPI003736EF8D
MIQRTFSEHAVSGKFIDKSGERFYKISHVDQMAPFFISVVSSSDHWLFISSTGSLSAGRIRPENALFPYKSVDHIHESAENTGSKTIVRVHKAQGVALWEPFNPQHDGLYQVSRNLYKNTIGDKILFEEINHTLGLKFEYSWATSEEYGFVRESQITNLTEEALEVELLDGIQNLLPSGAPLQALQTRSALVDAYKWNERAKDSSLALFTMYAKLSDRADPAESLLATTVFSLGMPGEILLTSRQVGRFRKGLPLEQEMLTKGARGSYLLTHRMVLGANQSESWQIVADIDKTHSDVCKLKQALQEPNALSGIVNNSVSANQQELVNLMSGADAWQLTADESTSVHHYANVLFNNMRGGVVLDGYVLDKADVEKTMRRANRVVCARHEGFFAQLPESFTHAGLVSKAKQTGDQQLVRLSYEYLPLTFGRRHGDPSRPWNHYEIKLKDEQGERLLSYQGNWRDIFQNWEAMAMSYPGFIQSFIAKFVNASTMDGYNPYRITKDGVDWELLEPDDPWSNIGYWGDHQIIYLLKFLELADKFDQQGLIESLSSDTFSYANVPYELCGVEGLFNNPKDTVNFRDGTQALTEEKTQQLGSDGKLVLGSDDEVYLVNLMEKVLVPLLAKLSNLVVDGGIWLNTQRPEWNDANNAIVGNGLSMVTLYYMRRYVAFMQKLLDKAPNQFWLSLEVADWMVQITEILEQAAKEITQETMTPQTQKALLTSLARAAEQYRNSVYKQGGFSAKSETEKARIDQLLSVSLEVIDSSCRNNLREDGLYNAYNILNCKAETLTVDELYPMLEGQVAVLSSGLLSAQEAVELLDQLFDSAMYREDQHSFMLYPDRELSSFMDKNVISSESVANNPALMAMLEVNDQRLIIRDSEGKYHFNAGFENVGYLNTALEAVQTDYPNQPEQVWLDIQTLYEQVFNHKAFTGRSGTMFGYEGLGCIYWHMVSKLLLAVQENYQAAWQQDPDSLQTQKLAQHYYRVREGIGFNKTPDNYGAFPTDPYSHTPKSAGAQQPGMTGQVKEEVLTRFGELGIKVENREIKIEPSLLKRDEFLSKAATFVCQSIEGVERLYPLNRGQLAFTYCQVPFIYTAVQFGSESVKVTFSNGHSETLEHLVLTESLCEHLFSRSGLIDKVEVTIPSDKLMG